MVETHGRQDKFSNLPAVSGYNVWTSERSGVQKGGGGLAIYYRCTLPAHQWSPVVEEEFNYIANERQWLLVDTPDGKIGFLNCYIACKVI